MDEIQENVRHETNEASLVILCANLPGRGI